MGDDLDNKTILVGHVEDAVTGDAIQNFEVVGFGSWDQHGLPAGDFKGPMKTNTFNVVTIVAQGYPPQSFSVLSPKESGPFDQTYKLCRGGSARGVVTDGLSSKPLAGVLVKAYNMVFSRTEPVSMAVTGVDGTFLLSKLPPGKVLITAFPDSPLASAHTCPVIADDETYNLGNIAAWKSGSLYGCATRLPSNQPVLNTEVQCKGPAGAGRTRISVFTDSSGNFNFSNLTEGSYVISMGSMEVPADVESGEAHNVEIVLGSVKVEGATTQAGEPVFAQIELVGNGRKYTAYSQSGTYDIMYVVPGVYTAKIRLLGGGTTTSPVHEEQVVVPDQPEFIRDFNLP